MLPLNHLTLGSFWAGLPAVVTKGHFSVDKNLLDLEKSL
jgi:hypothetical protein